MLLPMDNRGVDGNNTITEHPCPNLRSALSSFSRVLVHFFSFAFLGLTF
jgi:hypothetical protein